MSRAVAIIIPTHNRSDLLRETLASAFAQTHEDLQIVVVDDASDDDTPSVVAEIQKGEPRLQFHRFESSVGACKARNTGLSLTDAPFVNFLDSDDLMHPRKIELQLGLMSEHPEADLVVCQMAHFSEKPGDADVLWNTFLGDDPRTRFLGHDPVWGIHAPLWRRPALEALEGLDESLPMAQDYDLHVRALLEGHKTLLHPDLLTYCRRHSGPSVGQVKLIKRHETLLLLFEKYRPLILESERKVLATDYLFLASLATRDDARHVFYPALKAAAELGVPSQLVNKFMWLSLGKIVTKRNRFFHMMQAAATKAGYDVERCSRWYMAHRIKDEPNLRTYDWP